MDILQKFKDKPLYEVPEHYFEQLQQAIMQRVTKEEKQQKAKRTWISVASIAASIAVIVTLSYFIFVSREINEPFYVHEELATPENEILQDSNCLAEVTETPFESVVPPKPIQKPVSKSTQKTLFSKAPLVAETIVYRAVDYYLDDFTTDSFCETMYDLECYFDY